ncbi:SixA phosphatase family protein [Aerococcaceae bacterium WGS1372]
MELVLIRHAKAEEIYEGIDDIDRQLTEKGKDKFAKIAVKIADRLKEVDSDQLIAWSSPGTRAMETAEILIQQMMLETIYLQSFIYDGGIENLREALVDIDEEMTVLVFGHEPILSGWIASITGEKVRMRKGMAVSMKLENLNPIQGEVQWMVEPE